MVPRLLLELFLLILPFIAFGLYRLAIQDAEVEGRKAWPITSLFLVGIALAVGFWLFLLLREERGRDCVRPDYIDPETGRLIQGQRYDCEIGFEDIGVPRSEDPGGQANGVGADPDTEQDPVR